MSIKYTNIFANQNTCKQNIGTKTQQQNTNTTTPIRKPAQISVPKEVSSEYYKQFGLNITNNISSEKVSLEDNDTLQEIYNLDKEAFKKLDPRYDSFEEFKNGLTEDNLTTYAIKDKNTNNLLGYYQIKPTNDKELYIDSIGLKAECRNTRKGYNAIRYAWDEIQDIARENNANTLSLHVDSTNQKLIRMYKSLGFEIQESMNNYYENRAGAYFMTKKVSPKTVTPKEIKTQKKQNTQLTLTKERYKQIEEELKPLGITTPADAYEYLEPCISKTKTSITFDNDKFICLKHLLNLQQQINTNNGIAKKLNTKKIIQALTKVDENGDIVVHKDILPYIDNLVLSKKVDTNNIPTILCASKLDKNTLDFASKVNEGQEDAIKLVSKGDKFNKDAADAYLYFQNKENIMPETYKALISTAFNYSDGEYTFDKKNVYESEKYLYKNHSQDSYKFPLHPNEIKAIMRSGCTLDLYLKYYNKILNDKNLIGHTNLNVDTYSIASLINAAAIPQANGSHYWDKRVPAAYTQLKKEKTFNFSEIYRSFLGTQENNEQIIFEILASCRIKKINGNTEFSPELIDKAIQLKNANFHDDIQALIELSKIRKNIGTKQEKEEFCDDILNAIIEQKNRFPQYEERKIRRKINCCKDIENGNEYFNTETYALLKNQPIKDVYYPDMDNFIVKDKTGQHFDKETYKKYTQLNNNDTEVLKAICDEYNLQSDISIPNPAAINAYKKLSETNYQTDKLDKRQADINLLNLCRLHDNKLKTIKFSQYTFNHLKELLDKGANYNTAYMIINLISNYEPENIKQAKYNKALELINDGVDEETAVVIATAANNSELLSKYNILYNKGLRGNNILNAIQACEEKEDEISIRTLNEQVFKKLLSAIDEGFSYEFIENCKVDEMFDSGLYKLGIDMKNNGYTPKQVNDIFRECKERTPDKSKQSGYKYQFNYEILNWVNNLNSIGIHKENIIEIIDACKIKNLSITDAQNKVIQLHEKEYDDKGIAFFIKECVKDYKFSEDKYNRLLDITKQHKQLRDSQHGDDYVIEQLSWYNSQINAVNSEFGEDITSYAQSFKIDGYTGFVQNCYRLITNTSDKFRKNLIKKLDELPSPEQKVKRLRVLSGLAGNVDESNMIPLLELIKSPEMTDEQIKLANSVFSKENIPYKEQVEEFLTQINVPEKNQDIVKQYLLKVNLHKVINRPKPLNEQYKLMDKFAQQTLNNPKIPEEKKAKYISEYNAKKADMNKYPEKYTTPAIFGKPLEDLKKVITAYVNVPNTDKTFNTAVTRALYEKYGINTTDELLENIQYDPKYFDKLFAISDETQENFQRLIELVKDNPNKKLTDIRVIMPDNGSELHGQYENSNLINQILANQETNRQLGEHGINIDEWNHFNPNLNGETFSTDADSETSYQNVKTGIINSFNDDLFKQINTKETQKLKEELEKHNYQITNNEILSSNEKIKDNELGKFLDYIIKYTDKNNYWKSAKGQGNIKLPQSEIEGATGFMDHINGFRKKVVDIKNAREVNNIHFRLSDDDDIGRNIFLGNHVGCCNSIESNYAGFSAPMHLLNNYNRAIELVDKYGNSYGNSLCFFADIDGKLTFVIDSFEANGKLGSDPIVTKHLLDFSKQVCKAMGREDAQIMIGPNFNNMSKDGLKLTNNHTIKVFGKTPSKTYCDAISGIVTPEELDTIHEEKQMFELK